MSKIDNDFEEVKRRIRIKMESAAILIKEASEMALTVQKGTSNPEKVFSLTGWDFHEACRPLRNALDDAGWSSSSMSC